MIDRSETEIALATLIENNQAVTDDMDRLLEEMDRRGYDCEMAFILKAIREQRVALITAMQTARIGLSVAAQTE